MSEPLGILTREFSNAVQHFLPGHRKEEVSMGVVLNELWATGGEGRRSWGMYTRFTRAKAARPYESPNWRFFFQAVYLVDLDVFRLR